MEFVDNSCDQDKYGRERERLAWRGIQSQAGKRQRWTMAREVVGHDCVSSKGVPCSRDRRCNNRDRKLKLWTGKNGWEEWLDEPHHKICCWLPSSSFVALAHTSQINAPTSNVMLPTIELERGAPPRRRRPVSFAGGLSTSAASLLPSWCSPAEEMKRRHEVKCFPARSSSSRLEWSSRGRPRI